MLPIKKQIKLSKEVREYFTGSVTALFGIVRRSGPAPTIEEMDEAVGRYLAADDERIRKGKA